MALSARHQPSEGPEPRWVVWPRQEPLWLAATILTAAFAVIYIPSVGHGFIKDDFGWVSHSRVTSVDDVIRLLHTAPTGFFRPVVSLSFSANHALCGLNPLCYGISNFLLAVACAIGVYVLARAHNLPRGGALAAGAIWAFNWHGINMSLLWISGRTALLLVLFSTFAAAAFARRRFWLAVALCAAAMLSKEEAVLLPFILVLSAIVTWALDRRTRLPNLLPFAVGSLAVEGVYFYLRFHSGAFTPQNAPSFYRFTFSMSRVGSNVLQYLDRSATFAAVAIVLWLLVTRTRPPATPRLQRVITFGLLWWAGTLAITIFLPVRSSLYACLPSVGMALVAAVVLTESFESASAGAAKRAVVAGLLLPFLLMPIYYARNRPGRAEGDLSAATLKALQNVATTRGPETVVRLHDNRAEKPSLINPFGTFIQEATNLMVKPHIVVWIEPPPYDVALAGIKAPSRVDVELALRNGAIVPQP